MRTTAEAGLDLDVRHPRPRRLLLIGDELTERAQVAEVVVPEREVEERLARRDDSQPGERSGAACQLAT